MGNAKSQALSAYGVWGIAPGGRHVNVHWQCPAFEHSTTDYRADLNATLTKEFETPRVNSKVLRPHGSTNLRDSQETTSVVATAAGVGAARYRLTLQLNDRHCPQGAYHTTVDVTLTAP